MDRKIFFLAINFLDNRPGKVNERRVVNQRCVCVCMCMREKERKRKKKEAEFSSLENLHTCAYVSSRGLKNICLTLRTNPVDLSYVL